MSASPTDHHQPTIRPLTARSVVLSALLGFHPPELPSRALVRVGALFGIAEATIRVALTRMSADGDLLAQGGTYRLRERLVRRQEQHDERRSPSTVAWDGSWEQAVVHEPARSGAERNQRRKLMHSLRLGELREGVWLRPANLARPLAGELEHCTVLQCYHPDPAHLARIVWDLDAWATEARRLLAVLHTATNLRDDFLAVAETLQHLQVDPYLPDELLPPDWPGDDLRARYTDFRVDYAARLRAYATGGAERAR